MCLLSLPELQSTEYELKSAVCLSRGSIGTTALLLVLLQVPTSVRPTRAWPRARSCAVQQCVGWARPAKAVQCAAMLQPPSATMHAAPTGTPVSTISVCHRAVQHVDPLCVKSTQFAATHRQVGGCVFYPGRGGLQFPLCATRQHSLSTHCVSSQHDLWGNPQTGGCIRLGGPGGGGGGGWLSL